MSETHVSDVYQLPTAGFIRQSDLIPNIVPFSAATLWRKVKRGEFPRPTKLSERITAWSVQEVRDWLDSKARETSDALLMEGNENEA